MPHKVERMREELVRDAAQVLAAGAASPATLPKRVQMAVVVDWRRARRSEDEKAAVIEALADALVRAKTALNGVAFEDRDDRDGAAAHQHASNVAEELDVALRLAGRIP
jgi:phenylpyruvate tautomerase PptA (4-oxalocrotonate tautomerase family)